MDAVDIAELQLPEAELASLDLETVTGGAWTQGRPPIETAPTWGKLLPFVRQGR